MLAWIFATVLALIALAFIVNRRYFIGWSLHAIAGLVLINHYMDVNWSLVSTLIFIGLLVVIGVWAFLLRLPQFGLLAFMPVLYLTLQMQGADLHPVVQIFFWVFWVVGLISASIHSFPRGNATAWCVFVAAVLMICLNGLIASSNGEQFNPSVATNNIGGEQAWVAASQGTGTTPATCPDTTFQEWDPNTEFRLVSNGLWDNARSEQVTVEGAQKRQQAQIGTDARYLASTAWSLGLWDDPNKVAPLMTADKSCLSKEGAVLNDLVTQKWATATSTEIAEAPANGTNTGSNNGTFVVAADNGIEGDRTALVRKYSDGSISVDLIRCGNHVFVLPSKPKNVPPGRTDNPRPKSPPTTQSPPATTPPATPPASTPPPTTAPPTTMPPTSQPPTTAPPTTQPPTSPPPSTPPPTTSPPTTAPPTTAPPTTMPPTSQPPTTAPPTTQPPTETKGPVIVPSGDPTQGPPPGPVETAPIVEPTPADPEDVPGEEVINVPAPEVTQEPARDPIPDPDPAVPTTPGTGDVDPDGPSPVIPGLALGALGIGIFLRRKEFLDA